MNILRNVLKSVSVEPIFVESVSISICTEYLRILPIRKLCIFRNEYYLDIVRAPIYPRMFMGYIQCTA